MSKALLLENIEKAQQEIQNKKPLVSSAKMRQRYHFMAEEGWINDPNGLIFFKGKYHFFYQYNPYDTYWGAMHWGHAVSNDLLHWDYLPMALAPSETYDNDEQGGCFSGSAIEWKGRLYLFYTGTTKTQEGFVQSQCLAWSDDGINFEKYEGNPIIHAPSWIEKDNFRDPKVWSNGNMFYMVCGGKKGNFAEALLYRSTNLTDWEFVNVMFESRGEYGYMFECPDFFHIGDLDVITFSPMGLGERTVIYNVGKLNYETGKFRQIHTGEIDWGFDYYAPQSFLDGQGRRIMVAWSNAWDWMPWWKDWGPTHREGWCGSFNIPREVKLMPDYSLQFMPISELASIQYDKKIQYDVETKDELILEAGDGISGEIKLVVDLERTTASKIELFLRDNGKRAAILKLDLINEEIYLDRNQADDWNGGVTRSFLLTEGKTELDIDILLDQSSIEVFSCQYQVNHSCNVFADDSQNRNLVRVSDGKVYFKSIFTCGLHKTMDLGEVSL